MAVLRFLAVFVMAVGLVGGAFSEAEAKKTKAKQAAAHKAGKKGKKAVTARKKLRPAKMPKGGVAMHKSHRPKAAAETSSQLPESAPSEQLPAPVVEE